MRAGVPEASLSVTRMTPWPPASQTATAEKSPMLHASAACATADGESGRGRESAYAAGRHGGVG